MKPEYLVKPSSAPETEEALETYAQHKVPIPYQVSPLQDLATVLEHMDRGTSGVTVLEIPCPQQQEVVQQKKHTLGTYLAHRLEEIGVKDYFVIPGDFNLHLLDEILKNPNLRMLGCCNELNAGYAADGYARSSPARVAVVFVTFMVGGLSLINAIAGAYSDHLRVIVVSGAPPSSTFEADNLILHHSTGLPDRNQPLKMFEQVTAASVRLDGKQDYTQVIDQTLITCLEQSRPVYIEFPNDLVSMECGVAGSLKEMTKQSESSPGQLETAFDLFARHWETASRPVIIVGSLARHALSREDLISFIEKLGCPVFCQPDGKSLVPESHAQFGGTFWGVASNPEIHDLVMASDLWVVVGGRWSDFHRAMPGPDNRVFEILPDGIKTPDGDVEAKMGKLIDLITSQLSARTSDAATTITPTPTSTTALTTTNMVHGIEKLLTPRDTLIAETGDSWFQAQNIRLPDGADFQMQMMYGSIGWSLPAALGCQLARPEGRTVLMIGDGSFQMTAQELSTMIRMKTNPVIFILNNLGYRVETAIHEGPYNYISNWNYTALARSLCNISHVPGYGNPYLKEEQRKEYDNPAMFAVRIKTYDELQMALDRVRQEPEKLALLECCIHPEDVSPALLRFGKSVSKPSY
ncbi:hypothetical protein ASPZODRAFT_70296 [Penicilliopsis zonata CBS 506.65]|uniref:Pyruvate decarboxylase n=1 Tax=Penicilliopsis zonata CBS 506.65 TaxID=1073090 RepID=A0A1L9SDB9_9EURO|nr:hypothetical protein ASPZODRAFT_70296 [Penicilliopsis zonata CBS 506.65]OJJ45138.1 hypothetical protein ASPZODRAFT_70296 [Penicilliopsis zonata CBS 506.65]